MYVLGPARLDPESQLLTMGDRAVALPRKPFVVLLYLIENRHRMIYRRELLDRFWDGKEVYDQSLSKAVGSIRKAFGETRTSSRFIETRWGLGYRYVGPFGTEERSAESGIETVQSFSAPASAPAHRSEVDLDPFAAPESDSSPAAADASHVPPSSRESESAGASLFWTRVLPQNLHGSAISLLLGVALLLVFGVIAFQLHSSVRTSASPAQPPIRSVAVLPFSSNSLEEQDKYLGLGLADAVALRLGTVPQLGVRSSTTVRAILGTTPDVGTAAKRLAVEAVVAGEIHHSADKLVVSVRLLSGDAGKLLWSGSFDADTSNIFATEDSIARQVSAALLPQFGANALKHAPGPDTANPEAYAQYMKARFFTVTRTQASLAKAADLLTKAIELDPDYARAYAALADCYQLQGFYHFVPPSEAYPRARTAALKALSLDDSILEAHAALLSVYGDYDWDWPGVEREFRALVALDPNYAVAYQYYGFALLGMGRGDEALVAMSRAAEIDPVSPSVRTSLSWAYFLMRQPEKAVEQCQHVLELYPDFVPAHQLLGILYGQMKDDPRALAELRQAAALEHDSSINPILLDYELIRSGKRAEAARHLDAVLARANGAPVPDYYLALGWTALGDKQKALLALDRAYRLHSNWVIYIHYDPRFDNLRSDPRFQMLEHQIAFFHDESARLER